MDAGEILAGQSLRRTICWRLRTRVLTCDRLPLLMGIVNVTPDSFSDGGAYYSPQAAADRAFALAEQGADLIDIGAESTRPFATPVDSQEEWRRLAPVLDLLDGKLSVPLSIDTTRSLVARHALDKGVEVINDVSGLTADAAMPSLAATSGAGVCAMHMQGTPQTMQLRPQYADVVAEVMAYLGQRRDALVEAGVALERMALDPGIGFGKTHEHNLILLSSCHRFHDLGCPLLVGPSRKGFIAKVSGNQESDRAAGTLGVVLALARQGVQILRVHDVAPMREACKLFAAAGGMA